MMQKRTLYSLLIISFLVVLAASASFASNDITVESNTGLHRCTEGAVAVSVNVDVDVSAIELVLDFSSSTIVLDSVTWDLPAGVLSFQPPTIYTGVPVTQVRLAALKLDPLDGVLTSGAHDVAIVWFTVPDDCSGTGTISNGSVDLGFPIGIATSQFVDAATSNILPVDVFTDGSLGFSNQSPQIDAIADGSIGWGGNFTQTLSGVDPDAANCGSDGTFFTFVSIDPPAAGDDPTITGSLLKWQTQGADVCVHTITVAMYDACDGFTQTSFDVCVTNARPTITCPDDALVALGDTFDFQLTATDGPPVGPLPLAFGLDASGTTFPGTVTINAATGAGSFTTDPLDPAMSGFFTISAFVTDGANICDPAGCNEFNADTCSFQVEVRAAGVVIEKVHNQIQGQVTTVSIDMLPNTFNNWSIAGFDFLIAYDPTALTVTDVNEGTFFTDCDWEYFTYRFGPYGNCGTGCPSGFLRIVGLAETNDGANHPDCFNNDGVADPGPGSSTSTQLASIDFLVSNDFTFECQYVPIRFVWYDCGDNTLSDVSGQTLLMSLHVFDYLGEEGDPPVDTYVEIMGDDALPTYTGAPTECNTYTAKGEPFRGVNFWNGGVDIICKNLIDDPGDININGVAYEIADAVMFTRYFIVGEEIAFAGHVNASIAASDVNLDGLALSVADLVYLIRVVVGDALPYSGSNKVEAVSANYNFNGGVVSVDQSMGAAYFVVEGTNVSATGIGDVNVETGIVDGNTHVLVTGFDADAETFHAFNGDFLQLNGNILSVEFASSEGAMVNISNRPTTFQVYQNYPNPFNPTTKITFDNPSNKAWNVTIYNVAGQTVGSFSGDNGYNVELDWDASNLASGVYFYKVVAGDNVETKKAVLLK
jgi:hypothetical protein